MALEAGYARDGGFEGVRQRSARAGCERLNTLNTWCRRAATNGCLVVALLLDFSRTWGHSGFRRERKIMDAEARPRNEKKTSEREKGVPMNYSRIHTRTLEKAAQVLGGQAELADYLHV